MIKNLLSQLLFLQTLTINNYKFNDILRLLNRRLLILLPRLIDNNMLELPLLTLLLMADGPLINIQIRTFKMLMITLLIMLDQRTMSNQVRILKDQISKIINLLRKRKSTTAVRISISRLSRRNLTQLSRNLQILSIAINRLKSIRRTLSTILSKSRSARLSSLNSLTLSSLTKGINTDRTLPQVLLDHLRKRKSALAIRVSIRRLSNSLITSLSSLEQIISILPERLKGISRTIGATRVSRDTRISSKKRRTLAGLTLLRLKRRNLTSLKLNLLRMLTTKRSRIITILIRLGSLNLSLLTSMQKRITSTARLSRKNERRTARASISSRTTLSNFSSNTLGSTIDFLSLLSITPNTLMLNALLKRGRATFLIFLNSSGNLSNITSLSSFIEVGILLSKGLTKKSSALNLMTSIRRSFIIVSLSSDTLGRVAVVRILSNKVSYLSRILFNTSIISDSLNSFDIILYRMGV